MSDPIRQHYIPKFHLTYFTEGISSGSKLWITDKKYLKQYKKTPNTIAFEKDLYTLEPDYYEDRYVYEKSFSKLETEAAKVFNFIIENEYFPNRFTHSTKFEILMNYIALLAVRTPSNINTITKPIEEISKIALKLSTAVPERWEVVKQKMIDRGIISEEESEHYSYTHVKSIVNDMVDNDKYYVKLNQGSLMNMVLEGYETILPLLIKRRWILWLNKDRYFSKPEFGGFICSDNPVGLVFNKKIPPSIYSPGFGLLNTEISIPLSTNIALTGTFEGVDTTSIISLKGIASLNSRTGMHSDRYLFHPNKNFIYIDPEDSIKNSKQYLVNLTRENIK